MNDQKILELLAITPDSRAVQLADKLDAALEDVQASLAGLEVVGDVVVGNGFAPNGLVCKVYALSATFKSSAAYKPLAAKAAAANFGEAGGTYADRAVAFIRERGASATSSELHALLRLGPKDYASSYLGGALRAGRLIKNGKDWTLGPAELGVPAAAPVASPVAAASVQQVAKTESEPPHASWVEIPAFLRNPSPSSSPLRCAPEKATEPALPAPAAPTAPTYRCALWSDGILEVRRGTETVAEMPQAAGESLAAFLARVMSGGQLRPG